MPRTPKQNVDSKKVVNLIEKQEIEYWKKKAQALEIRVAELEAQIQDGNSSTNPVDVILPTEEEEIAILQLEKLKDAARNRTLTLDEVRMFDILVKNKRLAQGNPTTLNVDYKKFEKMSDKQLLSYAKNKGK